MSFCANQGEQPSKFNSSSLSPPFFKKKLAYRGYICRYHPDGPQSLSLDDIPEVPDKETAEVSHQKVASEISTARPEHLRKSKPSIKAKKLCLDPETEEVFVNRKLGIGILYAFQYKVYLSFLLELLVVALLYAGPLILEQLVDYIGNRVRLVEEYLRKYVTTTWTHAMCCFLCCSFRMESVLFRYGKDIHGQLPLL